METQLSNIIYYICPEDISIKFVNNDKQYPIIQIPIHKWADKEFGSMLTVESNNYRLKEFKYWNVKFTMTSNIDLTAKVNCDLNGDNCRLATLFMNEYSCTRYTTKLLLKDKDMLCKYVKNIIYRLTGEALKPKGLWKDIDLATKTADSFTPLYLANYKITSPLYYYFNKSSDNTYDVISIAILFYIVFLKYGYKIFHVNDNLKTIYDEFHKLCPDYKLFDE